MRLTYLATIIVALAFRMPASATPPEFKADPDGNLKVYFLNMPVPNYPDSAKAFHKKGKGWYKLRIDPATGVVREVTILKSTGVKVLDDSAAAAFLQWKAKPHLIDHAVIPVEFSIGERMLRQ
jgi:TonB family protein